jgi:hypothetical protein
MKFQGLRFYVLDFVFLHEVLNLITTHSLHYQALGFRLLRFRIFISQKPKQDALAASSGVAGTCLTLIKVVRYASLGFAV